MQERVAKLEETMTTVRERLIAIETTLGHLDRTVATKGELSSVESTLIKWFIATAVALSAITFAAAKFLH